MNIINGINGNRLMLAGKIAGGLVLGGATIALAGYGMQTFGQKLLTENDPGDASRALGEALRAGGDYTFTAGKYTAYTVLVPADILLHRIPKWTIMHGLPMAYEFSAELISTSLTFIIESIYRPALEAIKVYGMLLVEAMQEFGLFLKDHVIVPALNAVNHFAEYVVRQIVWPIFQHLQIAIQWAANQLVEVGRAVYEYVVLPAAEALRDFGAFLLNQVVIPALKSLRNGMEWAANQLVEAGRAVYEYVVLPAAEALRDFGHFLFHRIVIPSIEWMKQMVYQLGRFFIDYIIHPIVDALDTARVFLIHKLVTPILRSISECTDWVVGKLIQGCVILRDWVIYPMARGLYHLSVHLVHNVALPLIVKSWNLLVRSVTVCGHSLYESSLWIRDNIIYPALDLSQNVVTAGNEYVIQPVYLMAGQLMSQVAITTNQVVKVVMEDISRYFAKAGP